MTTFPNRENADTIKKLVEVPIESREVQFLTKLADLMDEYDAQIETVDQSDDVHIRIAEKEVWHGKLYKKYTSLRTPCCDTEAIRYDIQQMTSIKKPL
jgi:hypothetical protein